MERAIPRQPHLMKRNSPDCPGQQKTTRDIGYLAASPCWQCLVFEICSQCLRCELDAVFAHIYGLNRSDLEWILDAPAPGSSFPSLKQHEMKAFGEYRTQRYVLEAFDSLERGEVPDLPGGFA